MAAENYYFFWGKGPKMWHVQLSVTSVTMWQMCLIIIHHMQTFSNSSNSPPQSVHSSPWWGHWQTPVAGGEAAIRSTMAPVPKQDQWTIDKETCLIDLLSGHRAEAGDGASFKQATWNQAAAHMCTAHPSLIFSAAQCSGKWGRVC